MNCHDSQSVPQITMTTNSRGEIPVSCHDNQLIPSVAHRHEDPQGQSYNMRKLTRSEGRIAIWDRNDGHPIRMIVIEPAQQIICRDPTINALLLARDHLDVGLRGQESVIGLDE